MIRVTVEDLSGEQASDSATIEDDYIITVRRIVLRGAHPDLQIGHAHPHDQGSSPTPES